MGMENGELDGTPPPPPLPSFPLNVQSRAWGYGYSTTFLLCNLTYYFADDRCSSNLEEIFDFFLNCCSMSWHLYTKWLILSFVKISQKVPGQVKYQLSPWPVTRVYKVSLDISKKVFSPLHFVPQPRTHSCSLTRMKQIPWEGRWLHKKAKKSPSLYQLHDPHPLRLNQKDLQYQICLLVDSNRKQRVLR